MKDRERILKITAGNLRQYHLYINSHLDFFSKEAFGGSKRSGNGKIEIFLDGLNETVLTDIGSDAKTGKPRAFLRGRSWVRRFYQFHEVKPGTCLSLERVSENSYRLAVAFQSHDYVHSLRAAEFFAGIGLVRVALERKNWKVVFSNDIDAAKAAIYYDNWPNDEHLRVRDIHLLNPDEIPTSELFTASFPCNDLSVAGRWEGLDGKQSSAFWGFVEILRQLGERRPPLVLVENVVGFLLSKKGADFEKALLALNKLGYVVDTFILNAVHWVPQSRSRLFIVAQLENFKDHQAAAFITDARPAALIDFIHAHNNVRWSLQELPPLPLPTAKLIDILDDLPDTDSHWWDDQRAEYFINQMSAKHRAVADRMITGRTFSYGTAFRRVRNGKSMAELRTDGLAGCLRTPRGGSGRQILFKAGKGRYQVRLLTARECARLQGVPENFAINVPLNQALFGFGDAVCVPAIEWILDNYITPAAKAISENQNDRVTVR